MGAALIEIVGRKGPNKALAFDSIGLGALFGWLDFQYEQLCDSGAVSLGSDMAG